jgi:hypothetical protein
MYADAIAASQQWTLDAVSECGARLVDGHRLLARAWSAFLPAEVSATLAAAWDPEVIDGTFAFAGRLVEANRSIAQGILAAWLGERPIATAS